MNDSHVIAALKRRVAASSFRKVAAELDLSAAYLHDVLNNRRALSENLGIALGFVPVPAPPPPERKWRYAATNAATTKWERDNWPQVPPKRKESSK